MPGHCGSKAILLEPSVANTGHPGWRGARDTATLPRATSILECCALPVPGIICDTVVVAMNGTEGPGDDELLARIKTRDTAAFELLYDRHSRAAYGLAYRIVADVGVAEDVVQDSFLSVWRQPDTYGPARGSVRSWLLAIVHHRAIDLVRRRGYREDRQQALEDVALSSAGADTVEQVSRSVEGEQVREALRKLPSDQRRSIVLAYFGGYTHNEIARSLDLPLGTVKGRLRIGMQKMRGYLHAKGLEAPG